MVDNNLVGQLFDQISSMIDYKLGQQAQIKSAIVHQTNPDGTVDVSIPPSGMVYHNIQNQSIHHNLQKGDCVKVISENGNLSNMWIIGAFNKQSQLNAVRQDIINLDTYYPVGSVYISVTNSNPNIMFGGEWEQIEDVFLLGAGHIHQNGLRGGEATHVLTIEEMPSHKHYSNQGYVSTGGGGTFAMITNEIDLSQEKIYTKTTGGGKAHNNMPPYLVVYMWKRTK